MKIKALSLLLLASITGTLTAAPKEDPFRTLAESLAEQLPESKKPDVCVGCGKCSRICPQNIDIPGAMQDFCDLLEKVPNWEDICRERAATQPI